MKPGYKQTEVGVIPEEWEVKPFTQVTDLITCGIAATPEYVSESQGYPFLSSTNVKEGRIVWSGYKYISADLHRQLYRNNPPKRGDILYSRVGTFGEAAVVDVDFEFSVYVSLTLIKPRKPLDSCFLMQLLNSNAYKQRAKDQIFLGGGVGNLNVDVVRRYPIVVPPLPEQTAIAAALGDVDEWIVALEKEIEKKRLVKQGAMQELLSGKRRLPGFDGEWEEKRLGETCHITTGKKDVNEGNPMGDYPFFTCSKACTYSDTFSFDTEAILVAGNGEVGNLHYYVGKFEAYQRTYVLNDFSMPCSYLWHQLQYRLEDSLGFGKIGSSIPYIKREDLFGFAFATPKEMSEQAAIATVLSDMDTEIELLEAKLAKARQIKRGMMQALLTGRVRLQVEVSGSAELQLGKSLGC